MSEKIRYTFSLVTQGDTKFYSLTMPSDVLAECCFVTTREDDPKEGFQRLLDQQRAQAIADYIDAGLGTVPGSIVLSAQVDAELKVVGGGRSLEFRKFPKSFLVLDGQHRIYGFSLARTKLRVPVVIYNDLSRGDEARLFMDINTKQKPVPNPLLLDIKALADAEVGDESLLRGIFDLFHEKSDSVLAGLTSPASAKKGLVNRVTFNGAVKNAIPVFRDRNADNIYQNLNSYLYAMRSGFDQIGLSEKELVNPTVFKALMAFYPVAARRLHARFGTDHTVDNYCESLSEMWPALKPGKIKKPGPSYRNLLKMFEAALNAGFQI